MKDRYWVFDEPPGAFERNDPKWASDHCKRLFRNGLMEAPYSVPLVRCPDCDIYYVNGIYPFPCPEELKHLKSIQELTILPLSEYGRVREQVTQTFNACGLAFDPGMMDEYLWLEPGITFLDRTFSICCHPPFSFHWAGRGIDGPAVSGKVREAFEKNGVTGVLFHPVRMKYVGKEIDGDHPYEYYRDIYMPGQWDEDYYFYGEPRHIEPEERPDDFTLYHMYTYHWGPDWRDWKKLPRCPLCGKHKEPPEPPDFVFQRKHLMDLDVFRSAAPKKGGIVISKKVHEIIHDHGFTNYSLTPLEIHD